MPLSREPLTVLLDRAYNNYISLFKPLDKTSRYNLLKVFAAADAGMEHQILGDIGFLSDQIFPDTATGEFLRMHWSDRVPPLYAISAIGSIQISGAPNAPVPAGLVYSSAAGNRYFTDKAYRIGEEGTVNIRVQAQEAGAASNIGPEQELSLSSAIPPGVTSKAVTVDSGITGGVDAETDEAYLTRVLNALRNATRYGKPGDFASWAIDASPAVSKAWEFKNFSVFGALLIQVTGGNQIDGIIPVGNLEVVRDYISTVAPPVLFTVRTPALVPLNPVISLLPPEDTINNREIVSNRLKTYLQITAKPGIRYTTGNLRDAVIDGVQISGGTVSLGGSTTGELSTSILELPVLGALTWQ
jgi:uncharacterized phage protein gp47/JayE